jgi:TolA-binding protein
MTARVGPATRVAETLDLFTTRTSRMPRTAAGILRDLLVLVGAAGLLVGCASPSPPAPSAQAITQARPVGSDVPAGYPPQAAAPPAYPPQAAAPPGYYSPANPAPAYPPQAAAPPGYPPQGYVASGAYPGQIPQAYPPANGYPTAAASMTPPQATNFDRNVVPVSATDVGPAGPAVEPAFATGPAVSSYAAAPPSYVPPPQPYVPAGTPAYPPPGQAPPATAGAQPIAASPVPPTDDKPKDDKSGWDWSHLAPDQMWKDMKNAFGYGPDEKIAHASFDEGMVLFREKKYDEAAEKFYVASWRWPESTLEEDALFFMGESYFFADRYGKSEDAYMNLLKQHENSRYLDTVMTRMFAIARYWELVDAKSHQWPMVMNASDKTQPWFDTAGNGFGAYEMVRLHDPTGPLADAAVMAVANWHFRRGEWIDAADNYDLLRKDYPRSKFQRDAHVLGLQAKLKIYEGPLYDIAPLNDASQIADQTLKQFHGRLGPEEARIVETRRKIIEEKAAREWEVAQFYDKKQRYGAARFYYHSTIDKFPQSHLAKKARIRLQEIKDKPDNPKQVFAWLTGLFEPAKPDEPARNGDGTLENDLQNAVQSPAQQRERQYSQPPYGNP